jgi:PAS domain-containing protein
MTSHLLSDDQVQQVFELLAEHVPLGIVVLDRDFRLLFINQRRRAQSFTA